MTQHSTRATSPLPGAYLGSRLLKRSWLARLVLVAALLLAVPFLFDSGSTVHAADNDVTGLTLTSLNPGELAISWDTPSNAPDDYRVTWKKSSGKWPSYKNDNTVDGGNAFPTGTSHTVSDLEEGTEYSVRVRTRYHNSEGNVEESGPWSDPPAELTVSAQPPPKKGEGDSSEGRSTGLPAKPEDLLAAATHNSVLLYWTDPGDDSITGYQVLRGPDAANLAVLTNDTGNASASYTDNTVTAETAYAYAIRARNAGGLGPKSDPLTVTTGPAPVEPESDLAIAGVDFTLDGQELDTTGTCITYDINYIAATCTIDIETKSPVFAVVGTVDLDDRISIRSGRDLAAAMAASESANQNDLRGPDQTVDLTLPEGRNLLRIWGDEDETPGQGDTHFFRVNVVPYWEWNGERLSKDSACRYSFPNFPTVDEITDADCIVTSAFGSNTAEVRFFNVINEHYSVDVQVNGNDPYAIDEPSTTDLGSSFTVNLDRGDNLIRIYLGPRGGQPRGEDYDGQSFFYKVTGTDTLVSNLGQTSQASPTALDTASHLAMQFTTGGHTGGYRVSKVRLPIAIEIAGVTPVVSIYSDVSGDPGASIKTLTNPASITVSSTQTTEVEFDAGDFKLDAATPYWIVVEKPAGSGEIYVEGTTSESEDAGGAPGWSIAAKSEFSTDAGMTFTTRPSPLALQFAVKGALVSSDATLSAMALTDPSSNNVPLDPTFASSVESYTATVESYTAMVANAVDRIAVEPTKNDPYATIVYLDSENAELSDADDNTPEFDFALTDGENVLKVKVTSDDGMTKTYTVTVTFTRVYVLVSNLGQTVKNYDAISLARFSRTLTGAAVSFTTGGNTGGYEVSAVRLSVGVVTSATPRVSIYSDNSGSPGSSLKMLTNPTDIPSFTQTQYTNLEVIPEKRDFGADNFKLDAGTKYWIVIERESAGGGVLFYYTLSTAEDSGTAPGWSIGGGYDRQGSQPWSSLSLHHFLMQFAIKANAEPTGKPVISGSPERGQTLTADTSGIRDADGLSDPRYVYKWVRVDGATEFIITGSNSPSYLLTRDDIGKKLLVRVAFYDDAGKTETRESDQFPSSGTIRNKPNRQPTGRPTLSGTYQVGHTLTANTSGIDDQDGLTNPGYTYQWQRRESGVYTDISGADSMVYTLTSDDEGKRVRVEVTFTDDDEQQPHAGELPQRIGPGAAEHTVRQGQGVAGRHGLRGRGGRHHPGHRHARRGARGRYGLHSVHGHARQRGRTERLHGLVFLHQATAVRRGGDHGPDQHPRRRRHGERRRRELDPVPGRPARTVRHACRPELRHHQHHG